MFGPSEKLSGSLVVTLQFGTLHVTYAGLSISIPGFSSNVHVKPSFQYPPPFKLPLNHTQHLDVFKILNHLLKIIPNIALNDAFLKTLD